MTLYDDPDLINALVHTALTPDVYIYTAPDVFFTYAFNNSAEKRWNQPALDSKQWSIKISTRLLIIGSVVQQVHISVFKVKFICC